MGTVRRLRSVWDEARGEPGAAFVWGLSWAVVYVIPGGVVIGGLVYLARRFLG
jgi:hypothetical protein